MAISKRKRFEIFKRDLFTCRYCGQKPPEVILHVDHIVPRAKGGSDDDANLCTSCDHCNLGKSDVPLGDVFPQIDELQRLAAIQEMAEAKRIQESAILAENDARRSERSTIASIQNWLAEEVGIDEKPEYVPSIRNFVRRLTVSEIREAIEITAGMCANSRREIFQDNAFRYFCGVCWGKIKLNDFNEGRVR